MNKAAALQATGQVAAPFMLVVGASLATLAVVGRPESGRIAAPAPTVTVTAPPQPSPAHTTPPERRKAPGASTTLVSERTPAAPQPTPQPGQVPRSGSASAEQVPPSMPSTTAPSSRCTGHVLAVQVPLGVSDCALTVGGSR